MSAAMTVGFSNSAVVETVDMLLTKFKFNVTKFWANKILK